VSEGVRDLLVRGVAAARDGAKGEARRYLEWALRLDPTSAQRIDAWLWLNEVSDDPGEKRSYLEKILSCEPTHAEAWRKLAILDGRLDPADIIDPDNLPVIAPGAPRPAQARQFTCPHCGGRMVFTPDGASLTCEYCAQHPQAGALEGDGAVDEQDFVLALATAKGHTRPVAAHCLKCRDCGASFVLGAEKLSFACPYCASVYVVEQTEVREVVPPEAVIPFGLTRDQARHAIRKWLAAEELDAASMTSLSGVYLPMWTFDIDVVLSDKRFLADDVLAFASDTLPDRLAPVVRGFDLDALVPYDSGYLADWPAEMYDISMADASIKARARVRTSVARRFGGRLEDFGPSVARLAVMSFKLIVVPLWTARYRCQEGQYAILVNGQTGAVCGEKPARGLQGWLSRLMERE
jgi:predicted RNA-binding Zn-ribbon protein involved in translation (DUF1610 family)